MLKLILIGIIGFLNRNFVDGFNRTEYFEMQKEHLEYCEESNHVQLCQKSLFSDKNTICPLDYHVCGKDDTDYLVNIDKTLILNNKYYMTNIVNNQDKCESCSNPEDSIIVIERENNANTKKTKMCNIGNKYLNVGDIFKMEKCYVCSCQVNSVKCDNICTYRNPNLLMMNNNLNNCLNWNQEMTISCGSLMNNEESANRNIGIACCRNQGCKIPFCQTCVNNDEVTQFCTSCKENYYILNGYRRKCNDHSRLNMMCNGFYEVNELNREAKCLKCENGVVENNICVCKEGYFGKTCSYNYNSYYCSSNGIYNVATKTCVCDSLFRGKHCQERNLNMKHEEANICVNGFWKETSNICLCKKGFTGEKCNITKHCVNGELDSMNRCICENGYSGETCEKLGFVTQNNLRTIEENEDECYFGSWDTTLSGCKCYFGYEGTTCNKKICENGELLFQNREKTCICNEKYYGKFCQYNCNHSCNGNGNACNEKQICDCNSGWYGSKCQFIDLTNKTKIILMGKDIDIQKYITSESESLKIQHIQCLEDNCLPFMLKHEKNSMTYRRLDDRNINSNFTILNMTQFEKEGFVIQMYSKNNSKLFYDYNLPISSETLDTNNYFRYVVTTNDENQNMNNNTNNNTINTKNTKNKANMIENHTTLVIGGIIGCALIATVIFSVLRKYSFRQKIVQQREKKKTLERKSINPNLFSHYNQFYTQNSSIRGSNIHSSIEISPEYTKYSANPIMTNRLRDSNV